MGDPKLSSQKYGSFSSWETNGPNFGKHPVIDNWLVVWNMDFIFFHSVWNIISSQLTITPSFFRGMGKNHQPVYIMEIWRINGDHWRYNGDIMGIQWEIPSGNLT